MNSFDIENPACMAGFFFVNLPDISGADRF